MTRKILLATVMVGVLISALMAQQFTPPALPAGVQAKSETVEAEVLKIYSLEDQGAKFRAYVVKYKGSEVVVDDKLAMTNHKVGDKISVIVARVEAPFGTSKVNSISFAISPVSAFKKP
jgi:hypothetical protein